MAFILHSAFAGRSLAETLGAVDYSYGFLHQAFARLLGQSQRVLSVSDPADAEAIYDGCVERGEPCTLLSFTPPHKAPLGLRCRTVCVFAWEFNTIPDEVWDDEPRHDWRHVFAQHGHAIALSRHAAEVVRAAVGETCAVAAVAAPVWTAWSRLGRAARTPCTGGKIELAGLLIDTADHAHFSNQPGWPLPGATAAASMPAEPAASLGPVQGARAELSLAIHHARQAYRATLHARLPPPARWALSRAGRLARRSYLSAVAMRRRVRAMRPGGAKPGSPGEPARALPPRTVVLQGAVWTSVFNPADGRKNWSDMVCAFVWAFRDDPGATLVLKLAHRETAAFAARFEALLIRLAPFRCRVVAIGGWLAPASLEALVGATDIVVNASHAEGLCLPLMEFMSAGRPAIAPTHTAMADYITPDNAFTVTSTVEHNVWPHDTRDLFRTTRFRIEWDSLVDAFERSAAVLRHQPGRYAAMSRAASDAIERLSSDAAVTASLRAILGEDAFA